MSNDIDKHMELLADYASDMGRIMAIDSMLHTCTNELIDHVKHPELVKICTKAAREILFVRENILAGMRENPPAPPRQRS